MISWTLFVPACFLLNCAPGPNNLLAFTNASRGGFNSALIGGLGRMPAFALMILVTVVGLGAVLESSAIWLIIIKYLGAAYLVYVGVRMIMTASRMVMAHSARPTARTAVRRDFMIAITNPKAIAVFTAFFPQFIDPSAPASLQLAQMGAVFLLLECVAVVLYVQAGVALSRVIRTSRPFEYLQRIVGGGLIASGISMAARQ